MRHLRPRSVALLAALAAAAAAMGNISTIATNSRNVVHWCVALFAPPPPSEDQIAFRKAERLKAEGDELNETMHFDEARSKYEAAAALYSEAGNNEGVASIWLWKGHLSRQQGGYADATKDYLQALNLYQSIEDPEGEGDATYWLGMIDKLTFHDAEARTRFLKAQSDYAKAGKNALVAGTFIQLADLSRYARDFKRAKEELENARHHYTIQPEHNGISILDQRISIVDLKAGQVAIDEGSYAEAIDHLNAAVSALDVSSPQDIDAANARIALAGAQWRLGRYKDARETYNDSLRILGPRKGSKGAEANVFMGLAKIAYLVGDFDEALLEYDAVERICKDIAQELPEQRCYASLSIGRGDVAWARNDFDAAEGDYKMAVQFSHAARTPDDEAWAKLGLGKVAISLRDPIEARTFLTDAHKIFKDGHGRQGVADVTLTIGDLEASEGHTEEARQKYADSINTYRSMPDRRGEGMALVKLARLEVADGHSSIAQRDFEDARAIFHELNLTAEESGAERGVKTLVGHSGKRRVSDHQ